MSRDGPIVPALGFDRLTRFYDPVVALTTRERTFKARLLSQMALRPGDRLLDLGCGTGTLAMEAKKRFPEATVTGVDADPEMLVRAREKASRTGMEIAFDRALAQRLPYPDDTFDAVTSSLFFHHLDRDVKDQAAAEVARVLQPGGGFHVVDWGPPTDPVMAALFIPIRLLDGFSPTRDNVSGELPRIFRDAGMETRESGFLRTPFGTLRFYAATTAPETQETS